MAIRVALEHISRYRYDRPVMLGPQVIRLRPAPHCRTPVPSYSLRVVPEEHFVNWQQDPQGNFLSRFVFPKPTREFVVTVDLVADMTVVNPFDFFVEESARDWPFAYESWLERELRPFLERTDEGARFAKYLAAIDRAPRTTVDFLVAINLRLQQEIKYLIRLEPGVQTPEETLTLGSGSCRDSAWLLVQLLRHLGLAARFVSGYLIQLKADVESLDGPSGPVADFTDLHAWTEVFVPGAGWIGLDPTSGLFAGEGHLPLACTPDPSSAAPISGAVDQCECEFEHEMRVTRIHEDPRVTLPYDDRRWNAIERLGHVIDERLRRNDVRLTMGGEPTFVSIDDMDGPEWNSAAVGPTKRRLSEALVKRLRRRFAPGGLLHYGQGKWYPGESLPRWALGCYWRIDGVPIWEDETLIADADVRYGFGAAQARQFSQQLARELGVSPRRVRPAYEDVGHYLMREGRLAREIDPRDPRLADPEERDRLRRVYERGLGEPVGFVMPLKRQWWQARARWTSGDWPLRTEHLFLLPGDSPIGLRLPLDSLPPITSPHGDFFPVDPLAPRDPLPPRQRFVAGVPEATSLQGISEQSPLEAPTEADEEPIDDQATTVIRTALCVEPRDGRLHLFMPPVERLEDYLDLIEAIERTAAKLRMPVVIEGYLPPDDPRLRHMKVTPDPGVIEVNVHPSANWDELAASTEALYEEARQVRLGTEKFDLDGRHTGTGGGNHVVLGGPTPADSPFLRRPDLLRSMVGYWNDHPSLSYLFSSRFIGPTSQAPRLDEGRRDAVYELERAFALVPPAGQPCPPWLVDRLFRDLLTDLTGNTHRAEFCIDKLYSPDSSSGRLGLVELRGFEMPPHPRMSLTQQLLIRGLVAMFWERPYVEKPIEWGTLLHDRFLLPEPLRQDFGKVIDDLVEAGLPFERRWFDPHFEFRFPMIGEQFLDGIRLEIRAAIEPWYVLGEEPGGGGTVRYVDSSVERLQVKVSGLTDPRRIVTCNGRRLPLVPTGVEGEAFAGVRYRAWQPPRCLHPTIPVHTPLTFDILDTQASRSIGGCTYHVAHPAGRNYGTFPVNALEAESRRAARFFRMGHSPGAMPIPPIETNPTFPCTLDLRRDPPRP
ncbi:MAG TPA: transglutaminase family protein [Pirellulaceae bacterium]|nr:transglutaminase family protein [Pirellulaceae bacterium]